MVNLSNMSSELPHCRAARPNGASYPQTSTWRNHRWPGCHRPNWVQWNPPWVMHVFSVSWDNSQWMDFGIFRHSHVLEGTRSDQIDQMGPEGTEPQIILLPTESKIGSFRIFSIMVFRSISSSVWIPGKDSPGTAVEKSKSVLPVLPPIPTADFQVI